MQDGWITKAEATARYGLSERTLERKIKGNELRKDFRRIPGSKPIVVVKVEDLERMTKKTLQPIPAKKPLAVRPATMPSGIIPTALFALQENVGVVLSHISAFYELEALKQKDYLTLAEAAKIKGLPKTYIDTHVTKVKVGRQYFFRRADLDRHTVKAPRRA